MKTITSIKDKYSPMKNIKLLTILMICLGLCACEKKELAMGENPAVVKLELNGYILNDTLEFTKNNKVICTAYEDQFIKDGLLFTADEVQVRKKGNPSILSTFKIDATPFNQTQKFFYDGNTLSNDLPLTRVSNPANIGMRLRYSTNFSYFYGGPVDIEIFKSIIDWETFEFTKEPLLTIRNVTASFSEFFELPPSTNTELRTENYAFKVYKAGTKDAPYKDGVDYSNVDQPNNFGDFASTETAGLSLVFSIKEAGYQGNSIGQGYQVTDIGYFFR